MTEHSPESIKRKVDDLRDFCDSLGPGDSQAQTIMGATQQIPNYFGKSKTLLVPKPKNPVDRHRKRASRHQINSRLRELYNKAVEVSN